MLRERESTVIGKGMGGREWEKRGDHSKRYTNTLYKYDVRKMRVDSLDVHKYRYIKEKPLQW